MMHFKSLSTWSKHGGRRSRYNEGCAINLFILIVLIAVMCYPRIHETKQS